MTSLKVSAIRRINLRKGDILLVQVPAVQGTAGMAHAKRCLERVNEIRLRDGLPKILWMLTHDTYEFTAISTRQAKNPSA